MIQVIITLGLLSGIILVSLKFSETNKDNTKNLQIKLEAETLMNSSLELAILSIQGYERNAVNGCLEQIDIISDNEKLKANIIIDKYYLLSGSNDLLYCGLKGVSVDSAESVGMVSFDIFIENYKSDLKIKLHKKVMQKI